MNEQFKVIYFHEKNIIGYRHIPANNHLELIEKIKIQMSLPKHIKERTVLKLNVDYEGKTIRVITLDQITMVEIDLPKQNKKGE